MSKSLIVVDSGSERYRRYVIEEAKGMEIQIVLVQITSRYHWCDELADYVIRTDENEYDDKRIVSELEKLGIRFDGILCYVEAYIELTSRIAEYFGLPFTKSKNAKACRNKYAMRQRFKENGIMVPGFQKVSSLKEAHVVIDRIGFPCVIKPVDGYMSIGVSKVESSADLERIFCEIRSHASEFVLEEYMSGSEVSVESLVYGESVIHLAVTEKALGPEPYFEEIAHYVPAEIDDALRGRIFDAATKGIRALEIENSAVHIEMRLTPRGLRIVEIGARLGGDKIPYLVRLATGINMAQAAIRIALGEEPHIERKEKKVASIRFIVPHREGYLTRCPDLNMLNDREEIVEYNFRWNLKDKICLAPHEFSARLGYFIILSDSIDEAKKIENRYLRLLDLEIKDFPDSRL